MTNKSAVQSFAQMMVTLDLRRHVYSIYEHFVPDAHSYSIDTWWCEHASGAATTWRRLMECNFHVFPRVFVHGKISRLIEFDLLITRQDDINFIHLTSIAQPKRGLHHQRPIASLTSSCLFVVSHVSHVVLLTMPSVY
uniref:SnoaL-like domain-containing protein n=1 Tax=Panagrellus redivivus TaxID=6233 RepID=A0A7E4W3M1_PANRE